MEREATLLEDHTPLEVVRANREHKRRKTILWFPPIKDWTQCLLRYFGLTGHNAFEMIRRTLAGCKLIGVHHEECAIFVLVLSRLSWKWRKAFFR